MHCYLSTPAFFLLIPIVGGLIVYSACRSRALERAEALRAGAEEARSMEESSVAAPSAIVVTGVVIAMKEPSGELSFVSPEAAAKNETDVAEPVPVAIATAVVIRDPL